MADDTNKPREAGKTDKQLKQEKKQEEIERAFRSEQTTIIPIALESENETVVHRLCDERYYGSGFAGYPGRAETRSPPDSLLHVHPGVHTRQGVPEMCHDRSAMCSAGSIPTETSPYTMRWSAWPRVSPCAICLSTGTATSVRIRRRSAGRVPIHGVAPRAHRHGDDGGHQQGYRRLSPQL